MYSELSGMSFEFNQLVISISGITLITLNNWENNFKAASLIYPGASARGSGAPIVIGK